MKVTICKIAEIANVSRGTVDKVLHDRPGVSDAVRDRVKQVASALNYRPNLIGKALAGQQRPKRIGIIVAPDYNPFVSDIKEGIRTAEKEIRDYGFIVDVRVLNTLEEQEQVGILTSFTDNDTDAVALFSIDSDIIHQKVNEIIRAGTPVVTYNSDIHDCDRMCFVGQDHFRGGLVAGDLMAKILGNTGDVLIITSLMELDCHRERIAGFREGIADYAPDIRIADITENQDMKELAYALTLEKIRQYPGIKGIYVTGGGIIGVGEALKTLGREIEIKVVCHDLVASTRELIQQGIVDFTIGQDPYYQGYQSVRVLFEYLLTGKKPDNECIRTRIDIRCKSNL